MGLGSKERYYFGVAIFVIALGFVLAHTAPDTLGGFAAIVGTIAVPLYGGALGKLWVEKNGNGK